MPYHIELLQEHDLSAILAIERQVQLHPWNESLLTQAFHPRALNLAIKDTSEQLAGYLFSEIVVDQAELLNISIAQPAQRQGLGKQLLQAWFKHLYEQAITHVLLEVRVSNHSAITLYQQQGFVVDGLRRNYYPCASGREDAQLMSLKLANIEV
ncbi:ribosomal protein S18-alanine N-acetyltransferase [Celerinatantimonas yamalensis]|uniref:[Ribosomal protein bS18]-alanine N-acetyltransferase n=1 Tax=Celerinatantimonas yamalensis TaxID=559956 RepID=A0ABW9G7Z6_9GAMM